MIQWISDSLNFLWSPKACAHVIVCMYVNKLHECFLCRQAMTLDKNGLVKHPPQSISWSTWSLLKALCRCLLTTWAMNSFTHGSRMVKRPRSPTQNGDNKTEGLSMRLTCRHAKAHGLCSFSVSSDASVSLKCNNISFITHGLDAGGHWKTPWIWNFQDRFANSTPTTNNDKLKTKSDRQSNARGQPQRAKRVKQVHSTPPSNPPICVYVKIHSVLFVLTDQELIQSSLTCCRKKLSAQCASLRQISPCLVDFLSP